MNDTVYRPGQWQVVIEESGVAALPADASPEKVVALAAMLARGVPELTEVIDVLSGGAITGLGSFAVALIGPAGTRFAVRGAVTVSTGQAESFSGEDITTWSERFIAGSPQFEIGLGDAPDGVAYPVRSGVVLASSVRVGEPQAPTDADEDAAGEAGAIAVGESDAEPVAQQEPEPEPEVPTETITPDEVALARGSAAEEPWNDASAQSDLSATIPPPALAGDVLVPGAPLQPAPGAAGTGILPPTAPVPAADLAEDIGDHDGATISLAEARRLRGAAPDPDAPTEALPAVPGEDGGATPARIRLSTGQVVELDRTVIIGRRPRSTRASGSTLPHLVAVESPESDISRNHLEVRPEGDSVVVIDLHTTNGSTLLRPGADPVRLHPGEPTLVLGGDVVDVGDGVTVMIEEHR